MQNIILTWETVGFALSGILSFVFHFAYEWSKKNAFVGAFTPVNESVWEHIKIIFFPYLFFSIVEFFVLKEPALAFWGVKSIVLMLIPLTIVTLFYTYSGIWGRNFLPIDILIGYISLFVAYYYFYQFYIFHIFSNETYMLWIWIASIFTFMLIFFTYFPPKGIDIFRHL